MIWIKTAHNLIVFAISIGALISSLSFVNQANSIYLEEAPKATQDLQKVFLPPIYRMQWFVFAFDGACLLYYIYQWPIWDCIKEKFPFFQYEAQSSEKADCTTLLLNVMFNLISKVSITDHLPYSNSFVFRDWPSESSLHLASSQTKQSTKSQSPTLTSHSTNLPSKHYRIPRKHSSQR